MKKTLLIVLAMIPSLVCFGQTNSKAVTDHSSRATAPAKGGTALASRSITVFTDPYDNSWNPAHISSYSRVVGEQVLAPPGPAYSGSKRAASLKPEIIRAGHVQIYSPITTAVARKNPLCVLDSTFLSISF